MEANIKQNTLKKNPYNNFSFWENKILNDENIWEGYFENKEITKTSKIIYTGIFDLDKNILQCGWAVYPCGYSLLGFLQYVFLPTSFFTWFDRKSKDFYIPVTEFNNVVSETLKYNDSNEDLNSVNSIKKSYDFISSLWDSNYDSLDLQLKVFSDSFNNNWDNEPIQKLFLKVFENPCEVYDFIKDSIAWDSKEFIEEDISMTLDALKFACENAVDEPLLSKRLIDILNTNAPILF
ncbi:MULTISPECIES: hypothetical protein [unclassified Clostridium]|uniref:hypothetical protein n=1 Tax=unclassified Clostridium TaxID=2614128 RepID=UPI000297E8BA|nr:MULTISPECIES: hypothetical protein [unclassified Clostridium]EKQ56979.1 MAG: hypothetical protein A370_01475 [Clostridium sp. Maddingley MBC34-26]